MMEANMEWLSFGLIAVVGLILVSVFALQVIYTVAEYHERECAQPELKHMPRRSGIIIGRHVKNPAC